MAFASIPKMGHATSEPCNYHPEAYQGLEMTQLAQELNQTGLIGRIHGAAAESQMFIMSVREPNNFFSHREFSLIPQDKETIKTLKQSNRHDLVCVRGEIIANPSPQAHIIASSVRVLEAWQQPEGIEPYQRQTDIPQELKTQTNFIGKVHAIGEAGQILVVGYKDRVIPVFVSDTNYTQGLYRGDIIKLSYQIQDIPRQPIHLQLDDTVEKPIEVLDAIASWNGKPQTLKGKLVKFPRSPQLKFDVYAMEVDTQNIKRYFTLINFQDMAEFDKIRQKLGKIWDENQATAIAGRNMLINPEVAIEAKGIGNIISTEQANPQILLETAEDVKIVSKL